MKFVQLSGGLGNQLFQIWFAASLVKQGHKVLVFDSPSASQKTHFRDRDPIGYLNLDSLGIKRLGPGSSWLVKNLAKGLSLLPEGLRERMLFDASAPGELPGDRWAPMIYRGYFQSTELPKTALETISEVLGLGVHNEKMLDAEGPEITVHYRRGDYLKHANTIGLLDDGFFLESCRELRVRYGLNRVKIFSDGDATRLRDALEGTGFHVTMHEDESSDPLENLIALSKSSSYMVVSNSSFSWWAAATLPRQSVTFPHPWFRHIKHPTMGLPGWEAVRSVWTD